MFTYTGSAAPSNVTLNVDAHKLLASNSSVTKGMLGDSSMTDTDRTNLVDWIRGKDLNFVLPRAVGDVLVVRDPDGNWIEISQRKSIIKSCVTSSSATRCTAARWP